VSPPILDQNPGQADVRAPARKGRNPWGLAAREVAGFRLNVPGNAWLGRSGAAFRVESLGEKRLMQRWFFLST